MGVMRIDGSAQARALGVKLNGNERVRPLAVISTPAGTREPWIDAAELYAVFGDLVDIYVVETGEDTWALSTSLPPLTQVYGGAGRVYPIGHTWTCDVKRSPLRFAYDRETGLEATRKLIADGLGMASAIPRAVTAKPPIRMTGVVKMLVPPDRAVVSTADGRLASVAGELTIPGVSLDRVLTPGMAVRGFLDRAVRRLDIRESLLQPGPALAGYRAGDLVLAVVADVDLDQARLLIHPNVAVDITRDEVTSNHLDDLRSLMTPGEVLGARVTHTGPAWRLSLLDVEDDEVPVTALSLVEGGPSWLLPPVPEVVYVESEPTPFPSREPATLGPLEPEMGTKPTLATEPNETAAPPAPVVPSPLLLDPRVNGRATPPTAKLPPVAGVGKVVPTSKLTAQLGLTVAALTSNVRRLEGEVAAMRSERQMLANQLTEVNRTSNALRSEAKRLRTDLRKRSRVDTSFASLQGLFLLPEEQFRFEVVQAWATRIPASDKARRPMVEYTLGNAFLESLDRLQGIKRAKVVDVVVVVLTGLVAELPSREVHRLRTSEAGGSPYLIREDGAACMRASLQTNTPSARRLRYWQHPSGNVELAKVALHDDYSA